MLDRDFPNGYNNDQPRHQNSSGSEIAAAQPLHPLPEPPHVPIPFDSLDPIRATEELAVRFATLTDEDYGDWMREANTFWVQYDESMRAKHAVTPEIREVLHQIHLLVQYQPDFKLTETRRTAVQMILKIRELLGAKDPIDIHTLGLSSTIEMPSHAPPYSLRLDDPIKADIEAEVGGGNALGINGEYGQV